MAQGRIKKVLKPLSGAALAVARSVSSELADCIHTNLCFFQSAFFFRHSTFFCILKKIPLALVFFANFLVGLLFMMEQKLVRKLPQRIKERQISRETKKENPFVPENMTSVFNFSKCRWKMILLRFIPLLQLYFLTRANFLKKCFWKKFLKKIFF